MDRLICGNTSAAFAPDSALSSFVVRGHEIMGAWQGSKGPCSGMTMWPVVGLVSASSKFIYDGQVFEPGKHGYLRGKPLAVEKRSDSQMIFSHDHDPATQAGVYPFANQITIDHVLGADAVLTTVSAANKSSVPLRFGAGLHPAFVWGADENGDHGDSRVTLSESLPQGTKIYRTVDGKVQEDAREDNAFEGGAMHLKAENFVNDAYFVVLPEEHCGKEVKLVFSCPHNAFDLEVTLTGWDGFGIWSKPNAASTFLCIEPLAGVALIDKEQGDTPRLAEIKGLRSLAPAAMFKASMNMRPIFKSSSE
ncbi:MAG TPA: hypothetical protein DCY07_04690 [Rhodospirillaceae bacterium]|nr:hypothetical protein [Rhodospirillaceae bacterium]